MVLQLKIICIDAVTPIQVEVLVVGTIMSLTRIVGMNNYFVYYRFIIYNYLKGYVYYLQTYL